MDTSKVRNQPATFTLRLRDGADKQPIGNLDVRLDRESPDGKTDVRVYSGRVGPSGELRVVLPAAGDKLRLVVSGLDREKLATQHISVKPDTPDVVLDLDMSQYRARISAPLANWEKALRRTIPAAVADLLKRQKIASLDDLRRRAADVAVEPSLDRAVVNEMLAHAELQLVSRDHKHNQQLIEAGFTDIFGIARRSRADFVSRMTGNPQAAELHALAIAKTEALKNLALEERVARANGFPPRQAYASTSSAGSAADPLPCACDCQSAVSPLAYVADLLDLVLRHVTYDGATLTMTRLEELFHQPFGSLPGDCSASEDVVRQVRLCIEVLRSKAVADGRDPATSAAVVRYPSEAYEALLRAIGTSQRELRLLRGGSDRDRDRKAQALGIPVARLADLLIPADAVSEPVLETLFGLQDTSRDPLSSGSKLDDGPPRHILRWQLKGVEWRRCTDDHGRIHATLARRANAFTLTLFKDSARSMVVAKGEGAVGASTPTDLTLSAENDSRLYGRALVSHQAANRDFSFSVVPELLTWQLRALIDRWEAEDHPSPAYGPPMPLVDPDFVTDGHLCLPAASNPAHALRAARSSDLAQARASLDRTAAGAARTIPELIAVVWPAAPPAWDTIAMDLLSRDAQVVAGRLTGLAAVHLSPEAFDFLNELRRRPAAPAPTAPEMIERAQADRDAMLDILLNVIKRRDLYPTWAGAETGISLSPRSFCIPAADAVPVNALRVSADQAAQWVSELERNSQAPIIDPDVLDAIPNLGPARGPGQSRLETRRTQLADLLTHLEALPATTLLPAWLDARLGGSDLVDGGMTLLHHLGLPSLDALQAQFESGRVDLRPQRHGLTPRELNALLTARKLVKATAADTHDWRTIFHILIQAEKRRYLYPAWREEEAADAISLSPEYFRLPDPALLPQPSGPVHPAELLEWRSPSSARRKWLSQLTARAQQRTSLVEGLRAAVDAAEGATLPVLRDALVDLVYDDPLHPTREARQKVATNMLLINAFESACRKTTRVAQAIECLQLLVWGILNRQIEDPKFAVPEADAAPFQDQWRWLQAYATWRAAMFVFLYPENVLLPTLRAEESRTALFDAIVFIITTNPSAGAEGDEAGGGGQQPPLVNSLLTLLNGVPLSTPQGMEIVLAELQRIRVERSGDAMVVSDVIPANYQTFGPLYFWVSTTRRQSGQATERRGVLCTYFRDETLLEDRYYIPLYFGLLCQTAHDCPSALAFLKLASPGHFNVLTGVGDAASSLRRSDNWLADRLDPHALAVTRVGVGRRYLQISKTRCLLDCAEAEFTADTPESLARARELYFTAQETLDAIGFAQNPPGCGIGPLVLEVGETYRTRPVIRDVVLEVLLDLDLRIDPGVRVDVLKGIEAIVSGLRARSRPRQELQREVRQFLRTFAVKPHLASLGQRRERMHTVQEAVLREHLQDSAVFDAVRAVATPGAAPAGPIGTAPAGAIYRSSAVPRASVPALLPVPADSEIKIPGVVFEFCVPPNPILLGLRLRTATGLFKLSHCMNLAGLRREVPAYAAPTDTRSGMPSVGAGGAITLPRTARLQGTRYRYKALAERAKQLLGIAQQLEATYLGFVEKLDQETYTLMRGRHDLGLANANVALQALRVTEAAHGITLSNQQWQRADFSFSRLEELLAGGLSDLEESAVFALQLAAILQGVGIIAGAVAGGIVAGVPSGGSGAVPGAGAGAAVGAVVSGAQAMATASSLFSMQASFERREEEWRFQMGLADFDRAIAATQQTLADDRFAIATQEETIADIGARNAEDVLNFLSNKFTSPDLYSWMSGVVGSVYRYCLQQATAMARLAQTQLAFERQEAGLDFILSDYWTVAPAEGVQASDAAELRDRRGTTGSARLLHDLYRLDQHAFTTDRRKLQMSRTLSLALHDPIAFQQFRETGILPFQTTLELFDRDFPGHYLRLIKRVRASVIALIPPTHGIKATLSSTGISRVVVNSESGGLFEERAIPREPESVALTAPMNDAGVFELQEYPDLLLPFEGLGVANSWELRLPRAANAFDFSTIADVLVTIDYTAMESPGYRDQVVRHLDRSVSADRPFSFRHQFADAWYDLHHADLALAPRQPLEVSFATTRADFPPNVTDLRVEHVTLFVSRASGITDEIDIRHLRFAELGRSGTVGGPATTVNGIVSTRRSNAGGWTALIGRSPVGEWTLALEDDAVGRMRDLFEQDQIDDLLFVLTVGGTTPAWPA